MILKSFSFIAAALFTLFIVWILGWLWFATTIALTAPDKEQVKSDAIVVLTGGNGRVNAGLDLLADKVASKLFISGVNKDVQKADIYRSWKKPTADKPCCIYLGYEAEDTVGNAAETQNWVRKNDIETMHLVTSRYHMPRAYQEISRALPETNIIRYPVVTADFENWKGRFWTLTFSEYNKTLISWLNLEKRNSTP